MKETLALLPALTKPAVCYPVRGALESHADWLPEYVRIVGNVGLSVRWLVSASSSALDNIFGQLAQIVFNSSRYCDIALHYSPYHWSDDGDEPAQLQVFSDLLFRMKERLDGAYAIRGIFLDNENRDWKNTQYACQSLNAVVDVCKNIFPEVGVHWFGQGTSRALRTSGGEPWLSDIIYNDFPAPPGNQIDDSKYVRGDSYSVSWYNHPGGDYERFRSSYASMIRKMQERPWGAWVSPGAGFLNGSFSHNLSLPDSVWYKQGMVLSNLSEVQFICFYPEPNRSAYWLPAFNSFVRGFCGMPLPSV